MFKKNPDESKTSDTNEIFLFSSFFFYIDNLMSNSLKKKMKKNFRHLDF